MKRYIKASSEMSVNSATNTCNIGAKITSAEDFNVSKLEKELQAGINDWLMTPSNYLDDDEDWSYIIDEFKSYQDIPDEEIMIDEEYDDYDDLGFVVEVTDIGRIKAEVRAELGYSSLMDLADFLNPIIQKYDNNTYFEPEDAGILTAYIDI